MAFKIIHDFLTLHADVLLVVAFLEVSLQSLYSYNTPLLALTLFAVVLLRDALTGIVLLSILILEGHIAERTRDCDLIE